MKAIPDLAPDGKWELPNPKLLEWLGQFVLAWSLIEATLEVGIGKQLGTKPLETSIVTAGLMFKSRASILSSLLSRNPKKHAEALRILTEIERVEDRNDIMHSVIGGSANLLWFNRRKTKRRFTSKIERYHQIRLNSTVLHISDLSGRLMKELGITREDYLHFFQQSHNAVNSASGSP